MAAVVNRTPFSIGYIEQAYFQGLLLPYAAIRNQTGHYVIPSTQNVAADAAHPRHLSRPRRGHPPRPPTNRGQMTCASPTWAAVAPT